MRAEQATTTGPLTCGVASRAISAQSDCGDRAVTMPTREGALIAVIDGLGHGPAAAVAASTAAETLCAHAGESPPALLQRCHQGLRRTRGAAISLAHVADSGAVAWTAVGNVQGVIARKATGTTSRLVVRGGVVGLRLPAPRTATATLEPGDALTLFTDGVADAAASDLPHFGDVQRDARRLLDRHATGSDDALVLVAGYTGAAP